MSPATHDDTGALLPWYLNGTLAEDELRAVEAWLRDTPGAEAELDLWRAVQREVRAEALPAHDGDLGWHRLRRQLPRTRTRSPAWSAAIAASLLLVAGLQTTLLLRGGDAVHRPLSDAPGARQLRVQLQFAAGATLADVGTLCERYGARIVDGPSALGLYTLELPPDAESERDALLARLRAEPLVVAATVAP